MTSFSTHPAVERLAAWMLPTVNGEWENRGAAKEPRYLEVTPDCLTGFGFSIQLRDLPNMPALRTLLECWGFGVAVAEAIRKGSAAPDGVRICPLYVENTLNLAVGNTRVTVGLGRVTSH